MSRRIVLGSFLCVVTENEIRYSMKRLFDILFAVMLLSLSACQQEEPLDPEIGPKPSGPEFTAQVEEFGAGEHAGEQAGEGTQTKTALANGNSVVWSVGDQIAVFQGASAADRYVVNDDYVGSNKGLFEIVEMAGGSQSFQTNVAIYPYEEDLSCARLTGNEGSYQITGVTIPAIQNYSPGSFADESFPMAAVTEGLKDHNLSFRNLCGVLKLQLKGTAKVKTIELRGNDNEPLSGDATVIAYSDGSAPMVTMSPDASPIVSLDCGAGVQLNETTATDFLIAIPPTAFEKGFTVIVLCTDGSLAILETSKANAVQGSYIHTMPEMTLQPQTHGLITQLTPGMTCHLGAVSGPKGTLNVNSDYNSWSYTVPNDCEIFVSEEDKSNYGYLSVSVVPAGASSGVRYRLYSGEDTLPTMENPLEVGAGSTVYVSVRKNVMNWAFYTTDVISTASGMNIMSAVASNHLILRNTSISDEMQNLLILKKCVNTDELFLGQNFMKIVDHAINSNCWRLGTLDLYKRIGNEFVICESGLIISGEWECAIKESGAEDFMGGNAHGDERILEISATLDGKSLDLSSSFVTTGVSLDIVRHSLLNRCNTPGDNVIDHVVSYNITAESIIIDQTAEWLQDMVVENSYLLMCPISRAYTTSAMIEGQSEVIDISYAGHSRPNLSGDKGHFSLWGDKFSAEIEYECLEGAFDKAFSFISPSTSPAYNKFYYNFVGPNVQVVKAGHKVTTHGVISYSYKE